jgi:hypothetical protein
MPAVARIVGAMSDNPTGASTVVFARFPPGSLIINGT